MEKKDVIEFFGGVRKTARALGISHAAVINWGDSIPVGRAYQVQVISKGKLKVKQQGATSA
jgi:hypothetical protein